jgi:hypothetical protein
MRDHLQCVDTVSSTLRSPGRIRSFEETGDIMNGIQVVSQKRTGQPTASWRFEVDRIMKGNVSL